MPAFAIFNLGTGEIILIVLVILLLFGTKRLPDLMRSMGKSVSEFKKGINEVSEEIQKEPKPPEQSSSFPIKPDPPHSKN